MTARRRARDFTAIAATAVALSLAVFRAEAQPAGPTVLQLEGVVTRSDIHSYIDVPFEVPDGVAEIAVQFEYDTRNQRTTLDLGLWDPQRFRGWSGGSRSSFVISAQNATPGYLPGAITVGTWRLVLGVPNIRDNVRASYRATVELRTKAATVETRARRGENPESHSSTIAGGGTTRREVPGWFRGDLHVHTEHSDGTCLVEDQRQPCPLGRTLAAARERGLDFIAITEHNTVSHVPVLPDADDTLTVLPGQEVTTFRGHLNAIGLTDPLAFRREDGSPRDPNEIASEAQARGAFVVINHPGLPSGEACMGCGWRPAEPTTTQVHAVEVINGGAMKARNGTAEGIFSGIPFWQSGRSAGHSWIPVGASDNHDPDLDPLEPSALGRPATVVWARSAAAADLLDGLKSGRLFVDIEGHPSRSLEISLQSRQGEHSTPMGGRWTKPLDDLEVLLECNDCVGLEAHLLLGTRSDAHPSSISLGAIRDVAYRRTHTLDSPPPDLRWLRIDLRRPTGELVVLGNAIDVEP